MIIHGKLPSFLIHTLHTIVFRVQWVDTRSSSIQPTLAWGVITWRRHVSQSLSLAILVPGSRPALLIVVVKGVPSVGMGSGQIGPQYILPVGLTPLSSILHTDIGSNAE